MLMKIKLMLLNVDQNERVKESIYQVYNKSKSCLKEWKILVKLIMIKN